MPARKIFRSTAAAALVAASMAPAHGAPPLQAEDESAIRQIMTEEVIAWNHGDAAAFTRAVRPDCVFTNVVGMMTVGRAPFEAQHAKIFATIYKGTRMRQTVTHLRLLAPGVAILDTDTDLAGAHWRPPGARVVQGHLQSRLEQVLVKNDGAWGIASFHNVFVGDP